MHYLNANIFFFNYKAERKKLSNKPYSRKEENNKTKLYSRASLPLRPAYNLR